MGTLIYFVIYAIVVFLTFISRKINRKSFRSLSVLICILILSIFGGIRDYSVGTDVTVYGLRIFSYAIKFKNFFDYINFVNIEGLFATITYIVSRFTNDYHMCLFVLQLITNILIYKIAYDNEKDCSFTLIILVYLLTWYNSTFNILRQSISILIMIYAYKFIKQNQKKKFIICLIVSILFHKSAIICLLFPIISKISQNKKQIISLATLTVGTLFLFYNLRNIIQIFDISQFSKYEYYILTNRTNMNLLYFLTKLAIFTLLAFFCAVLSEEDRKHVKDFLHLELFDVLFYLFSSFVLYGYRISYYFLPFLVLLIPNIYTRLQRKQNKMLFIILILFLLIIQWFVRWYIIGYDGVIPYKINK